MVVSVRGGNLDRRARGRVLRLSALSCTSARSIKSPEIANAVSMPLSDWKWTPVQSESCVDSCQRGPGEGGVIGPEQYLGEFAQTAAKTGVTVAADQPSRA